MNARTCEPTAVPHCDPTRAELEAQNRQLRAEVQRLRRELDQQAPLRRWFEASADCLYALDLEGRLLLVNPQMLDLLGQEAGAVLGQSLDAWLPLREALQQQVDLQQVLRSGRTEVFERVLRLNHQVHELQIQQFPWRDAQGVIVGVGCIGRDVSVERAAQRDQRLSEEVFLNSREAILVADLAGLIQRVNPAFERLTGYSGAALQQRPLHLLHAEADDPAAYRQIWEQVREQGQWSGELNNRTVDGRELALWSSINPRHNGRGERLGYMVIQTDLSELRGAQDELTRQATTDSLTGLPNRTLFRDRLQQAVRLAERQRQSFALLFADLDHFKEVNDNLGHATGDELLVLIAKRLRDSVREVDSVARLGGDEFVMLLPDINRADALKLAHRLVSYLHEPVQIDGLQGYRPQASVGLVLYPEDGDGAEPLLRRADQAMYAAKRGGRNQLQVYEPGLDRDSERRFGLHLHLRQALDDGQLCVHLQPKFRLSDLAVVGAEALVRWQHPQHGLLGPSDFMAIAEQHQMLGAIDAWVLRTTLEQLSVWGQAGRWPADWQLSVNLNASDLQHARWLDNLCEQLQALRLPPRWLDLELTEAVWARPTAAWLARMRQLREMGVTLSIDDFGTGYSSLAYLKQLPISQVKIDQSFVRGMLDHEHDRVLVETIVELTQRLGLSVIAEGIETEAERAALRQAGCELGQGYLLSRPVALDEFERRFLAPA